MAVEMGIMKPLLRTPAPPEPPLRCLRVLTDAHGRQSVQQPGGLDFGFGVEQIIRSNPL